MHLPSLRHSLQQLHLLPDLGDQTTTPIVELCFYPAGIPAICQGKKFTEDKGTNITKDSYTLKQ